MRFHVEMLEGGRAGGRRGRPGSARRGQTPLRQWGLALAHCRSGWGWTWIEALIQGVRFALRAFRRDLTAAAVIALALGTGLAIAIFTIVNAILLRPLPYREPDRLVMIWAVN